MACSAVRSPILRNTAVRHYATAAVAPTFCPVEPHLQTEKINNNIVVSALENNSPIAQVSIIFRAGPRNETYHTQGVSHHLRIAAGLTTSGHSYFGITRNVQQLGGNIITTSDRESTAYTLQVTKNNLNRALVFLEDVATKQLFKPWEISDQLPRLRYELSKIPETTRLLELLHKAAYRAGLGYSLYSPKRHVGSISTESLQHFVNAWFTNSRCAVVATGVSYTEACIFASNLVLSSQECCEQPTKYYGGEIRKERNSTLASVAVALESAGINKEKDALAFAILQKAAGTGPQVKWGSSISPLYKAVASAACDKTFAVSALNASYSDSGLFGVVLCCEPSIAGSLTTAAYKWLKSPKLTDSDICRGKNALKAEILYAADNGSALIEMIGQQALFKGYACTPMSLVESVEKVTLNDVKNVAHKLSSGKPSLAAIGDICCVPYLEELS